MLAAAAIGAAALALHAHAPHGGFALVAPLPVPVPTLTAARARGAVAGAPSGREHEDFASSVSAEQLWGLLPAESLTDELAAAAHTAGTKHAHTDTAAPLPPGGEAASASAEHGGASRRFAPAGRRAPKGPLLSLFLFGGMTEARNPLSPMAQRRAEAWLQRLLGAAPAQ